MAESVIVPGLCQDCQRKEKEGATKRVEEGKGKDLMERRREALAKAEKCAFFRHHTLYDDQGQEDPLMGTRTCSFAVKYGCGHEELKYGVCRNWMDGQFCNNWKERI